MPPGPMGHLFLEELRPQAVSISTFPKEGNIALSIVMGCCLPSPLPQNMTMKQVKGCGSCRGPCAQRVWSFGNIYMRVSERADSGPTRVTASEPPTRIANALDKILCKHNGQEGMDALRQRGSSANLYSQFLLRIPTKSLMYFLTPLCPQKPFPK